MKHYWILLLFIMCIDNVHAQKLNVESFVAKTNDITARTQSRQDINGNDCALVKVRLAAENASFSGNVVGDVAYDKSEYFVYMPQGSKRLTIKLEGYLPLEVSFSEYGIKSLESKVVYQLTTTNNKYSGLFDKYTGDEIYEKIIKAQKKKNREASEMVESCILAANLGDVRAQNLVGILFEKGVCVAQDYNEAIKYLREAAEQGYAKAQYNLGIMYDDGIGVLQDHKEAVNWFRKSAEQGIEAAQFQMGIKYYTGDGVDRNIPLSIKWFDRAAKQGNKKAKKFAKEIMEIYQAGGYD